jgi:hypothetical protein
MKRLVLVGALVGAVAASSAVAQATASQGAAEKPAAKAGRKSDGQGSGHAAPKPQPATDAAPSAPEGQLVLGTVHIPKRVKANGEPLPPGTYQVRLTPDPATPPAKGQTPSLERWAEFVKGGKVVGREVVTIVPQGDTSKVQKDPPPRPGSAKVETLKGGDYVRVWINRGGNYYLVYLPTNA